MPGWDMTNTSAAEPIGRSGGRGYMVLLIALCLGLLLLVVIAAPQAAATTVVPLSLDELVEAADSIAVVRVSSSAPREKAGEIETAADLRVLRILKGNAADARRALTPGGTLGGRTMVVPGAPELRPGEKALLFLDAQQRIIGAHQGKMRVEDGFLPGLGMSIDSLEVRIDSQGFAGAVGTPSSLEEG